jgi:Ca2+-binding RTX toxin-like protein
LTHRFRGTPACPGRTGAGIAFLSYALPANVERLGLIDTIESWATRGVGNDLDNVIIGGSANSIIDGRSSNDTIYGADSETYSDQLWDPDKDTIHGGTGNDQLYGDAGHDVLSGREGADRLSGGAGNDLFNYDYVAESKPGAASHDVILDFTGVGAGPGDKIDLASIDANGGKPGNPAFVFVGTGPLTGAGQIHVIGSGANTLVQGEVDGKVGADFEVLVQDGTAKPDQWVAGDFVL